jgi:hypothetical protein
MKYKLFLIILSDLINSGENVSLRDGLRRHGQVADIISVYSVCSVQCIIASNINQKNLMDFPTNSMTVINAGMKKFLTANKTFLAIG